MTNIERLNAALDEEPFATLRILGDAYEDAGQHALASGYRWLAKTQRYPAELFQEQKVIGPMRKNSSRDYRWTVTDFDYSDQPFIERAIPYGSAVLPLNRFDGECAGLLITGCWSEEAWGEYREFSFPALSAAYHAAATVIGRLLITSTSTSTSTS